MHPSVTFSIYYSHPSGHVRTFFGIRFPLAGNADFYYLLVPKKHLARIAGLNQSLEGLARILMPPLGALLIGILPMQGVLAIDIGTAMIAIGTQFFIRIPKVQSDGKAANKNTHFKDLKAGLQFVKSLSGLLILIIIGPIFSLLMFPALSFQPLLVMNNFCGRAMELAWLQSGFGVGIVLGGISLSAWGGFKRKSVIGFLGLILRGIGLGLVGLAAVNQFWLAIAALFVAGFMPPIVTGSLFLLMQASVPPAMQGRVFTLIRSGFSLAPLIGLVVADPLAELWGVHSWFVLGGVAMIGIFVIGFMLDQIREFEDNSYAVDPCGNTIVAD